MSVLVVNLKVISAVELFVGEECLLSGVLRRILAATSLLVPRSSSISEHDLNGESYRRHDCINRCNGDYESANVFEPLLIEVRVKTFKEVGD